MNYNLIVGLFHLLRVFLSVAVAVLVFIKLINGSVRYFREKMHSIGMGNALNYTHAKLSRGINSIIAMEP